MVKVKTDLLKELSDYFNPDIRIKLTRIEIVALKHYFRMELARLLAKSEDEK